ncbi:MAG: hypothetical protein ACI83P_001702, partial [Janthinobacterium sp.]
GDDDSYHGEKMKIEKSTGYTASIQHWETRVAAIIVDFTVTFNCI